MMDINTLLGNRIRRRRKLLQMTLEELSEATGITMQSIQKYETGANQMKAARIVAVTKALGMPVAELFDGI